MSVSAELAVNARPQHAQLCRSGGQFRSPVECCRGISHARECRKRHVYASHCETMVMLSFSDRVEVPKHVLVRFLKKESVFLNLETEQYYGLDETGTRMWQLVTAAPSIENAYAELLSEFDVSPDLLRQNLSELLGRLADFGLLRVHIPDVETDPAI